MPGQGNPVQVQTHRLPVARPLPRADSARSCMCPPDQDRQRADGDPRWDGPEPPQGDAAVQQHLQPAQLREDRLHSCSPQSLCAPPFAIVAFGLLVTSRARCPEVQFRPYRTDDFITRLYYETPRFTVLNQTWVLKARVNDSERNPNLSCKRTLSFQLLLKSKVTAPLECSFLLLKGPYDDVRISPVIYHFVFTNESNETDYVPLPIIDSVECNKLLAAKNINLRLFLFQIQK
ncbi:zinc finger TRAF-type-containing protein 1 isoform X4 [Macaca fascicularis]|uniref:zinc finger TRAF-type-containing protein 1 isoform X4 n=1 Tax=Macaca fascicularis TaxID=9541 RepID=UPI003D155B7A